jgi:hypothetical protein
MQSDPGLAFVQDADDLDFANRVQRPMVRALDLIVTERRHHAFCVRSPSIILKYKDDWQLAWAERWPGLNDEAKSALKQYYEQIEILELAAQHDVDREYESAKRRSVILLADLLESYVETIMQLCIVHSLKLPEKIKILTGKLPLDVENPVDVKWSVREWEKHKFPELKQSRALRFVAMFNKFMPMKSNQPETIDEIIYHRNKLTHEIIQIGDIGSEQHRSADAATLSLELVDRYFDAVSNFIIASMEAFKGYKKLEL